MKKRLNNTALKYMGFSILALKCLEKCSHGILEEKKIVKFKAEKKQVENFKTNVRERCVSSTADAISEGDIPRIM